MASNMDRINFTREMFDGVEYSDSDIEGFDRKMSFVIHGRPISDSRPRHSKKTDHFYNPHKQELMDIVNGLYEISSELREACIQTPVAMVLKAYMKPDKGVVKLFGVEAIETDKVWCVKTKDNDNIEKVTFDVLQDEKFMIILDDRYIVHNATSKFYSFDDRLQVDIHFWNTFKHIGYETILKKSAAYAKLLMSRKYIEYIQGSDKNDIHKFFIVNSHGIKITEKAYVKFMNKTYGMLHINAICAEFAQGLLKGSKEVKLKYLYSQLNGQTHNILAKKFREELGGK